MATEMRLQLSLREKLFVGLTLALAPLLVAAVAGVRSWRARYPHWAADPRMPHGADLLEALGYSALIVAARFVLTRALKPLGRLVLEPSKRTSEDRVERFTTVLFKLRCAGNRATLSLSLSAADTAH